jgi:hypothetical protein
LARIAPGNGYEIIRPYLEQGSSIKLEDLRRAGNARTFRVPLLVPPSGNGRDVQVDAYRRILGGMDNSVDYQLALLRVEQRCLQAHCWWLYSTVLDTLQRVGWHRLTPAQRQQLVQLLKKLPCDPVSVQMAMSRRRVWVVQLLSGNEVRDSRWCVPRLERLPRFFLAWTRQRYLWDSFPQGAPLAQRLASRAGCSPASGGRELAGQGRRNQGKQCRAC